MRHLSAQRGVTLIELLVALAIFSTMLLASGTFFGDFITNSRLRESGNALLSEMLIAQSEAVKRNSLVSLVVAGNTLRVIDVNNANTVLRTVTLPGGVIANANVSVGGAPRPRAH